MQNVKMSQVADEQQIIQRVWKIVDALPQRDLIASHDAKQWVADVVQAHGEMAVWHAIRLNGFGGSEIGVLVRNRMGVRADHQASAHDIVEGKLMRRAPLESSAHMQRGHENEEPHSRRFWTKYGAVRDLAAYDALKNATGQRPWMRYSPDDMVLMPLQAVLDDSGRLSTIETPGQMHRWLIDYKAPSKVEESDEIAFQYACQLTQGAILCAENDVSLDGMMLSQFDWANWALKDDVVAWDESLGLAVIEAGDFYWDMVMQGQVPAYVRKPQMEGVDQYTSRYLDAAQAYANLSSLADAAKKRADEIRAHLLQPISSMRLGDAKIDFGAGAPVLTVKSQKLLDKELTAKLLDERQLDACSSSKAAYDADAMAAFLRSQGENLKPFRKYELDASKVFALAADLGMDADALVAERIVLSPSKSIKAQMAAYIDEHYPVAEIVGGGVEDFRADQIEDPPVN